MTEREGYQILSKPYIRTADIAKILDCDVKGVNRYLNEKQMERIHRGFYITAEFIDKFKLNAYWNQVKRFADK